MFLMAEPIIASWFTPATNTIGQSAIATVDLEILLADSVPATLTAVATGVPNEITLSWAVSLSVIVILVAVVSVEVAAGLHAEN
jgi:hypothetical protein